MGANTENLDDALGDVTDPTDDDEEAKEEEEEQESYLIFTDDLGRVWRPHVTLRACSVYERETGVCLYSTLTKAVRLIQKRQNEAKEAVVKVARQQKASNLKAAEAEVEKQLSWMTLETMFDLAMELFGGVHHVGLFLFESCRDINHPGPVPVATTFYLDAETGKPTKCAIPYDEFGEAISKNTFSDAYMCAFTCLMEFLPGGPSQKREGASDSGEEGEETPGTPFGLPGLGKLSSKL